MKKIIVVAVAMLAAIGAYAQGTVNFSNFVPAAGINAPVFGTDGTTKLVGPQFKAVLLAGPAGVSSVGSLAAVPGSMTDFKTGSGAGFFIGGQQAVPGVAPGATASLAVGAFDSSTGADYASASIKGTSAILQITTGGAGQPPGLPANMVGLSSFSLKGGPAVPEPSTLALGVLGAAALLLRRRK